ncbi:MAG: hypothetical protein KA807_16180 [Prolixibacteraceae bacterium]|nr:hypothetical protein [Prolixibacteraceae bacterium]
MKIKNVIYFFLSAIILVFSSCKDELIVEKICDPEILYFRDMDEYKSEMDKVLNMTSEERDVWQQERGFKSFGIAAERFYKSIDQEKFKSIDEFKQFVNKNSKYIQLIEENGDYILETQFYNNPGRYFMNEEGMFQIGENVYRIVKSGTFYCRVEDYELLKDIDTDRLRINSSDGDVHCFISDSFYKSSSAGCGSGSRVETKKEVNGEWYMTRLELDCGNMEDIFGSFAFSHFKVSSYKRGFLWIYYNYESTITYNAQISLFYKNDKGVGKTEEIRGAESEYTSNYERMMTFQTSYSQDFDGEPFFKRYYCVANNGKTNDATLSCSSN